MADVDGEMADLEGDLDGEVADLDGEVEGRCGELHGKVGDRDGEVEDQEGELHDDVEDPDGELGFGRKGGKICDDAGEAKCRLGGEISSRGRQRIKIVCGRGRRCAGSA